MSEAKELVKKMCELQNESDDIKKEIGGWKGVVQYKLGDEEFYVVYNEDGTCEFSEGKHESPSFTIVASPEYWLSVLTGQEDPIMGFMSQKYRIEGNIFEAQKLSRILKKFAGKI